jgi:hypothetical protein
MAAESIKVTPPAVLQAASSAAMTAEKAAAPHPGVVPLASPRSPADGAAATIAAGMGARTAQLSTKLAGKGPQVQAKTQAGVTQLQGQDEQNATRIQQVADETPARPPNGHGAIQATDFHTFKDDPAPTPPKLPDPVSQLHLPNYNPGTLSPDETRTVYLQGEQRMRQLNEQLIQQGISPEQRARTMFDLRNQLRSWTRGLMSDRGLAGQLDSTDPNLTLDQLIAKNQAKGLTGNDVWNSIIDSSTRSRGSVNANLGIDPANPPELPPVRPAPVEPPPPPPPAPQPAAPPAARAPVEAPPAEPAPRPAPPVEGGEGPMLGGPGIPFGPHVIHPPHSIPHHFPILGQDDPWEDPRDFK